MFTYHITNNKLYSLTGELIEESCKKSCELSLYPKRYKIDFNDVKIPPDAVNFTMIYCSPEKRIKSYYYTACKTMNLSDEECIDRYDSDKLETILYKKQTSVETSFLYNCRKEIDNLINSGKAYPPNKQNFVDYINSTKSLSSE